MHEETPSHFCPACGTTLRFQPRYPWHFCGECLALAQDGAGRALSFGNAAVSGGLTWHYTDDPGSGEKDCTSVGCLIRGREILVMAARFGGVVAQPANRALLESMLARRGTDLTGGADEQADLGL